MKYESSVKIEKDPNSFDLSIIVVCYNNCNFIKSLVQDLTRLPSNCEIVVVDNNSSDDTTAVMQELLSLQKKDNAALVYLQCLENLWHSGGCNKGFHESRGRNILFLNDDVRVTKDYEIWHENLIKILEVDKDFWKKSGETCKLVGPTFGYLRNDFSFIKESNRLELSFSNPYLSGWCLAGTRTTFDALRPTKTMQPYTLHSGPWNKDLFYFNDVDLSWRAKEVCMDLEHIDLPLKHFGKTTVKKHHDVNKLYLEGKEKFTKIWRNEYKEL